MKKTFNIEIDCPNCALKCEEAIKKLDGIISCSVNYITQRMVIESENFDSIMPIVIKTAKKIEPDFEVEL